MSRPLRIEFPGACYHVSAEGNAGQPIFTCAEDGARFLGLLGHEVAQQRWRCHGWCLMETRYSLLVETPEANLGRGMGRLAMGYSQWFGRRHGRRGHLFAGRYRAVLFEKTPWLPPLARSMVLEPVRAGLVRRPEQWHWSSHRALLTGDGPAWLAAEDLLDGFDIDAVRARRAWAAYVADGIAAPSPWESLRNGQYIGGPAFRRDIARRIAGRPLDQVSRTVANPARPIATEILAAVAEAAGLPDSGMPDRRAAPNAWRAAVYLLRRAANMPIRDAAALAGVSQGRVSQIQRAVEDAGGLARSFPWAKPLERLLAG